MVFMEQEEKKVFLRPGVNTEINLSIISIWTKVVNFAKDSYESEYEDPEIVNIPEVRKLSGAPGNSK